MVHQTYLEQTQFLQSQYLQAFRIYLSNKQTVAYYEQDALKNIALITETTRKQYAAGEINYLEWVMLTNQTATVQSNYIDAVRELNESIIELQYLTSK